MQETNSELLFGSKNVIQNNSMTFEMKVQKWRLILPFIIILFVVGGTIFSMFSENPEGFQYLINNKTDIIQSIQKVVVNSQKEAFIGFAISLLFIIFILVAIFLNKTYIKIDSSQLIVKNLLDQWLGRPGQEYLIANPGKLTGKIKGRGNKKRLRLKVESAGGEVKRFNLAGQTFGNKSLYVLLDWLKKNRQEDMAELNQKK